MTDPTLRDCVAAFLAAYRNLSTRAIYARVLTPFIATFPDDTPLSAVTFTDLDVWFTAIPARYRPATVANRVRSMKRFWNWCVERELVAVSPARFLKRPRYRTSASGKAIPDRVVAAMFTLTAEKQETLIRLRDLAVLALLDCYGPRRSEVATLRLRSIDWLAVPLPVITFNRVKTATEDTFPVPANTAAILRAWVDYRQGLLCDHDFLFVTNRPDHGPASGETISTLIKRLSEKITGGRMYGPHSFRHRKGQSLADARVPPDIVQTILGHASLETTLRFYYGQDTQRVTFVLSAHEFGAGRGAETTAPDRVIPFPRAAET